MPWAVARHSSGWPLLGQAANPSYTTTTAEESPQQPIPAQVAHHRSSWGTVLWILCCSASLQSPETITLERTKLNLRAFRVSCLPST